jgi:hypothetical protein
MADLFAYRGASLSPQAAWSPILLPNSPCVFLAWPPSNLQKKVRSRNSSLW